MSRQSVEPHITTLLTNSTFSEFECRWIKDQNGSASGVCKRFEDKFRRRIALATVNHIRKLDVKKASMGASVGATIRDPTQEDQDPDASTTLIRQETHLLAGVDPFRTLWLNDGLLTFLQAISSQDVRTWGSDVSDENPHDQPKPPDSCRLKPYATDSQLSLRADRDRERQRWL